MDQPRPLFHQFSSFKTYYKVYNKYVCEKIRCWDTNSRHLDHDSLSIATRPGLPPFHEVDSFMVLFDHLFSFSEPCSFSYFPSLSFVLSICSNVYMFLLPIYLIHLAIFVMLSLSVFLCIWMSLCQKEAVNDPLKHIDPPNIEVAQVMANGAL